MVIVNFRLGLLTTIWPNFESDLKMSKFHGSMVCIKKVVRQTCSDVLKGNSNVHFYSSRLLILSYYFPLYFRRTSAYHDGQYANPRPLNTVFDDYKLKLYLCLFFFDLNKTSYRDPDAVWHVSSVDPCFIDPYSLSIVLDVNDKYTSRWILHISLHRLKWQRSKRILFSSTD